MNKLTTKKDKFLIVCTEMLYIKLFFENQVKILSDHGTIYVLCSDEENLFSEGFGDKYDIKRLDQKVGRKISILNDLITFFYIIYFIYKHNPKMVLSLMPKSGFISMMASRLMKVSLRIHMFTGQVWANSQGFKRVLLKLADRITAKNSTGVLGSSFSEMKYLIDNRVVRQEKINVMGNGSCAGVNLQRFDIEKRLLKEKRLGGKNFTCIFIGRLTKDKGFDNILNVFDQLGTTHPEIKLIVVGIDEENFVSKIKNINSKYSNIFYVGYSKEPEEWLSQADLLLLPSHREGFGSVVIEAGAMGLPCIGSKIYGMADSIKDGETGLKIESGNEIQLKNAILRLQKDKKLYRKLSTNCYEYVCSKFDEKIIINHWRSFFKKSLVS